MQHVHAAHTRTQPNQPEDRLVKAKELATYLGIGLRTLYRLVHLGQLPPPIKLGTKAVRWRFSTIEAFVDKLQSRAKES